MATLISGYIKAEKLEEILKVIKTKGDAGFGFTVVVNDEPDQYGNNVQFHASQTKEQREQKVKKWYFGNGKVFWTNGVAPQIPQRVEQPQKSSSDDNGGLPF